MTARIPLVRIAGAKPEIQELPSGDTIGGSGGAIGSISNADSTLTISPTTGNVVASIARAYTDKALFDYFADANNGTTVETDLYTDTSAADQFATNGDKIMAEYFGITANNANTKRIRVYFAGTVILDSTAALASSVFDWYAKVIIIRESSSVVRCFGFFSAETTTLGALSNSETTYTRITGLTLSGTNILKITGQSNTASSDITAKAGTVQYIPAA